MYCDWKHDCNYWRKQDALGKQINIIQIDGIEVEVSDEIYELYVRLDRKERYAREMAAKRHLPLEQAQKGGQLHLLELYAPSAEDEHFERITMEERAQQKKLLRKAIGLLTPSEQAFIQSLFQNGLSPYELARLQGVSFQSVYKRQKRIVKKLKQLIENCQKQG